MGSGRGRLRRPYARLALGLALVVVALACRPARADDPFAGDTVGYGELEEEWRGEMVHLSWKPRAFLYKKFLSDEECEHIKDLARPLLTASDVVNTETGVFEASETRTSTGTFLEAGHDEVVRRIEKRVAQVTMTPVENQENMQVLRYANGQKYEPHFDYFLDPLNAAPTNGGQRLLTALMFLHEPEEGGETVFPDSETQTPREGLSPCVKRGLANVPKRGDLLMFYALTPDGLEDPTSLHGSCPTLKGEKWSATIWIHVGRFQERGPDGRAIAADVPPPALPACRDENDMCSEWAFFGECEKNPGYMLEGCRVSCNVCRGGGEAPKPPAPLEPEAT
ncbi:prolyl 4-hydroxylase-like [Raphidocelis subcapitata]|uniref:procollagen-proline 4-dioxygenase n=1 Tax=Raphidocelis subcapitata TaxID=307507 RepID=A0A2V0PSQ7_9CHLO|nr:prolyl 4-hydroxylase-like [Raphidocelis subcapitata]|eukprot:GBG00386.1 prolyl 4-hydroxylase-like [Raphidocelis subcapitata]